MRFQGMSRLKPDRDRAYSVIQESTKNAGEWSTWDEKIVESVV